MQEVPTRPANQAPAGAGESDAGPWLVSYADDDDREMTAADIFRALSAGEIDMDSIAWRDGMAEWQAINEIAPLRAELERLANTRGDRKRTVMGGFSAQQNAGRVAPSPQPGQLSGTRPAAAATPAVQLQSRSTLLGTGAQPLYGITGAAPLAANARGLSQQNPNPRVADLNDAHRTANAPKATLKSSPLARQPAQANPYPTALPDPTDDGPESWDQEPTVSLHQDSIVSLPPEALESVVAFLPPMDAPSSPRGIFEVDSNPPPQFIVQNAPGGRQQLQQRGRANERAGESILEEPTLALPHMHVGPEAMRSHVNAPHPPRPPRNDSPVPGLSAGVAPATAISGAQPSIAPLISVPSRAPAPAQPGLMPQVNAPLADEMFVSSKPKGNTFTTVLLGLLLLGGIAAGMFYMGRQTAVTPAPVAKPAEPVPPVSTQAKAAETAAAAADSANGDAQNKGEPANKAEDPASPKGETGSESGNSGASEAVGAPRSRSSGGSTPRSTEPKTSVTPKPTEPTPAPKEEAPAPAPASDAPFDTSAASAALTQAAGSASSCRQGSDPSGVANVTVTFANSGRAINANVSGPPFAGTVTGGCIASKMRQAKVPPFGGDRITVRKQVVIQ